MVMGVQRHNAWLLLTGAVSVTIYWTAPHYKIPLFADTWDTYDKIAGSSYQILALALLVVMTVRQLAKLPDRGALTPVLPDAPVTIPAKPTADQVS
jgi:hypothetical protein